MEYQILSCRYVCACGRRITPNYLSICRSLPNLLDLVLLHLFVVAANRKRKKKNERIIRREQFQACEKIDEEVRHRR